MSQMFRARVVRADGRATNVIQRRAHLFGGHYGDRIGSFGVASGPMTRRAEAMKSHTGVITSLPARNDLRPERRASFDRDEALTRTCCTFFDTKRGAKPFERVAKSVARAF
jgi:hypothetical protein